MVSDAGGGADRPNPDAPPRLSGHGSLPKAARVLRRREFDRIQQRGVRVHRPQLSVVACRTLAPGAGTARFGCAVSRKVGNAVVRNRLKRLMREVFRQTRHGLPSVDLVVILRPAARDLGVGIGVMSEALLPALWEAAQRAQRSSRSEKKSRGGRPTGKPSGNRRGRPGGGPKPQR